MKKVLFFFENQWAFGSIHHGIAKELYKNNVHSDLLDWTLKYSQEEYDYLNSTYDYFVTLPDTSYVLMHYNINPKKIIIIGHEQYDIISTFHKNGSDYFDIFADYCVISEVVQEKSLQLGIRRIPKILKTGINFCAFYAEISNNLKYVGYGGAKSVTNYYGVERKRGWMVEKCINETDGIELIDHKFYKHLCVPSYYKKVDCIIMSSLEEAGGLPTMEAAAAGRLVIGTPVGYFKENSKLGGGIEVPIDEEEFMRETKNTLCYYRDNPHAYRQKCKEIQEYAWNYDWSNKVQPWIEVLTQ